MQKTSSIEVDGKLKKVQVFDPPMCCSSGVCGPNVDPVLPRFAADLEWLKGRGIDTERYNLAQQPAAFAGSEAVRSEITERGVESLPIVLVDGRVMSRGEYPTREQLAEWSGLDGAAPKTFYTEAVAELVAIGASIAANCEPCFKFHFARARKLGVSLEDMLLAVNTAQGVKDAPARSVLKLAKRILGAPEVDVSDSGAAGCAPGSGCC
ncbi:MAG: arsenite efflux transporter metallochaperone ArsD [Dehalococcoidales bacterium]|nr:arsenite efflux transporter metallochaperone ArsD [Dehalococcoidales bacterium]